MDDTAGRRRGARHLRSGSGRDVLRGGHTSGPGARRTAGALPGRSSPVNAWWGTFDLAVSLYSGRSVDPPSDGFIMRNSATAEQIEVGWWPGDARHPHAAFFVFAFPPREGLEDANVSPTAAHWDADLGEYLLDWDEARAADDPHEAAVEFGRSVIRHACIVCDWDRDLAASAEGIPPPVS